MLKDAKAEENRKLKEQIARLEQEKQELIRMQNTKEEEIRRFERTQKKQKKQQLQEQPDVSESEEEDSQGTDRMRPRRNSTDLERRKFTQNRNMTTKP